MVFSGTQQQPAISHQPLHVDAVVVIKGEEAAYLASLGCLAGGLHQL